MQASAVNIKKMFPVSANLPNHKKNKQQWKTWPPGRRVGVRRPTRYRCAIIAWCCVTKHFLSALRAVEKNCAKPHAHERVWRVCVRRCRVGRSPFRWRYFSYYVISRPLHSKGPHTGFGSHPAGRCGNLFVPPAGVRIPPPAVLRSDAQKAPTVAGPAETRVLAAPPRGHGFNSPELSFQTASHVLRQTASCARRVHIGLSLQGAQDPRDFLFAFG